MLERLVTIGSYPSSLEASLAQQKLEEAGIPAAIVNGQTTDLFHLGSVTQTQLQVAEAEAERALEALAEHASAQEVEEAARDSAPELGYLEEGFSEADERPLSTREERANTAFFAALLSLVLFPVSAYVCWLLYLVFDSDDQIDSKYRRRAWMAAVVGIPCFLVLLFVIAALIRVGLGIP